jgi:hypothetical protein
MKKHWYLMDGDALRAKYFRAAFFWGNGWLYQYGIQQKRKKETEETRLKPVAFSTAPVYYGPEQDIVSDRNKVKRLGLFSRLFQFLRNFR